MALVCCISGEMPTRPCINKEGLVFEKSLIEKYIAEYGKDPISGKETSLDDLIDISLPSQSPTASFVKPRSVNATGIPSLLSSLQNEWDAMMLETFSVREQLHKAREELAHSLYQHDAACRVIARLTRERDEARQALSQLNLPSGKSVSGEVRMEETFSAKPKRASSQSPVKSPAKRNKTSASAASSSSSFKEEVSSSQLDSSVLTILTETAQNLSKNRIKRTQPETLASVDQLKAFTASPLANLLEKKEDAHTVSFVSSSQLGSDSMEDDDEATLVLCGGSSKNLALYDLSQKKSVSVLKGHTKTVTGSYFDSLSKTAFSCSADKTVRVWDLNEISKVKKDSKFVWNLHKDQVTGIHLHPCGKYLASCSLDKSWALHDLESGDVLLHVNADTKTEGEDESIFESGFTCIQFHPDGLILGTGDQNGNVRIWDLKLQKCVATFVASADNFTGAEEQKSVSSLAFGENGYFLASSTRGGTLKLWDLRKLTNVKSIDMKSIEGFSSDSDSLVVNRLVFDSFGSYLAVVGSGLSIFSVNRHLPLVQTFSNDSNKPFTDATFFPDALSIAAVGLSAQFTIFS